MSPFPFDFKSDNDWRAYARYVAAPEDVDLHRLFICLGRKPWLKNTSSIETLPRFNPSALARRKYAVYANRYEFSPEGIILWARHVNYIVENLENEWCSPGVRIAPIGKTEPKRHKYWFKNEADAIRFKIMMS